MRVEAAFEAAHEAVLLNSTELVTGLGGASIYPGAPPTGAKLPYVIFAKPQVLDDNTDCTPGWEVFATTSIWAKSRPQPMAPAEIAGVVRELLTAELSLDSFRVVDWQFVSNTPADQPDGSTRFVVVHRYLIEPATA